MQLSFIALILILILMMILGRYRTIEGFSTCTKLLPIMDPFYNLREIVKNILLLEDHLFHRRKRCNDCIMKHFLIIEGLAEEIVSLDKDLKCEKYYDIAEQIRKIEKLYIKNPNNKIAIAQMLRAIRKPLISNCFSSF